MKVIFISGPSGCGKTTLSNLIILKIKNGFVLSTDNYYKTDFVSKIISRFVECYYDRSISFDYKLFKKDFNFILKNGISIYQRSYDFKRKTTKKFLKKTYNIKYLIVEGIFAKEFSRTLPNQNYDFLELKTNKDECLNRVVQRDFKERGKSRKQAEFDFFKSWDIYYRKFKNKTLKKNSNEYIISKKTNIDRILKNIFS